MNIVAIGDKVPTGNYQFHSRFTRVVNYQNEDVIISFVEDDQGLSGRALRVTELPRGKTPVQVSPSHVFVDGACLPCSGAKRYDSSFGGLLAPHLPPLVDLMKAVLCQRGPALSLAVLHDPGREAAFSSAFERALLDRFRAATAAMRAGAVLEAVGLFKGVGFGLTPSGDDFITGLLYVFSAAPESEHLAPLRRDILKTAGGCAALSFQFIKDAAAGIYPRDVKALFTAVGRGDEPQTRRCLIELVAHGHTSGADTVAGMIAGLEWWLFSRGAVFAPRTRG